MGWKLLQYSTMQVISMMARIICMGFRLNWRWMIGSCCELLRHRRSAWWGGGVACSAQRPPRLASACIHCPGERELTRNAPTKRQTSGS